MPTDKIAQLVLSVVVVFGFGGVLIAWMAWPPKPDQSNLLSALVGALAFGYGQVINYWFAKPSLAPASPAA